MGRRRVKERIPPYTFSVDSKKFPDIQDILEHIDSNELRYGNRSQVICNAVREWYQRQRPFIVVEAQDQNSVEDELLLKYETLFPSLTDPLSELRPSDTNMLYYFMPGDFADYVKLAIRWVDKGVDENRKIHGKSGFPTLPESIKRIAWDETLEFPSEDARIEAYKSAVKKWRTEEFSKLRLFIEQQAAKPKLSPMQKQDKRIEELEEENTRLKEELVKMVEEKKQQPNEQENWAGHNLPAPEPSTPLPPKQEQEQQPTQ